jgi:glycosyltransferase involved in cell wall biosynthesis
MVRPIDLDPDSRVKKLASSLYRIGYDVTVLGRSSTSQRCTGKLGGVSLLLVPPKSRLRGVPKRVVRLPARARRVEKFVNKALQRAEVKAHQRYLAARTANGGNEVDGRYIWWRVQRDFRTTYGPEIIRLRPDVIHVHDPRMLAVAMRTAARLARLTGVKPALVFDSREDFAGLPDEIIRLPKYHQQLLRRERQVVPRLAAVLTVSDDTADALQKRLGLATRPTVLVNAPPLTSRPSKRSIRDDAGVPADAPLVVFAGGLNKHRGVDTLVKALPELPGVHAVFVAVPFPHPREPELVEIAERLGVTDRLHFVAPVPSDEVGSYIADATVGISTTPGGASNHDTTLPNKLFEMLHAGLPIVTSEIRAMSRFVEENKIGVTYHGDDPVALARAVQEILADPSPYTDPERRAALSARWNWQAQEDVLAEAYGRVVAPTGIRDKGPFPPMTPDWDEG